MASKRRRYAGELATPIVWPTPPTFWGAVTDERVKEFWRNYERHQQEAEQSVKQQLWRKLSLLMKHFKIADENDTMALVWALASEHVPGFQVVPEGGSKKGRKKEWHGEKLQALYDAVQSAKNQHNFNDRLALKFISSNSLSAKTWGLPANYKGSKEQWVETLESRLQDAKRYVAYIEGLPALLENIRAAVSLEKFQK